MNSMETIAIPYQANKAPRAQWIAKENKDDYILNFDFPLVLKPIRSRRSQGVSLVKDKKELDNKSRTNGYRKPKF